MNKWADIKDAISANMVKTILWIHQRGVLGSLTRVCGWGPRRTPSVPTLGRWNKGETGSAGKTGDLPKGNWRGNQGHRLMNQQFSFCDGWCHISCS